MNRCLLFIAPLTLVLAACGRATRFDCLPCASDASCSAGAGCRLGYCVQADQDPARCPQPGETADGSSGGAISGSLASSSSSTSSSMGSSGGGVSGSGSDTSGSTGGATTSSSSAAGASGASSSAAGSGSSGSASSSGGTGGAGPLLEWVGEISLPGTSPLYVRAADLDHDGRLDLAVSDNHGSGVQLAYGLPDGGFVVGAAPGPGRTYGLDVADLDGDGALDLVTTLSSSAPYQVQVYFGDGARGFSGPLDLDASTRPQCVHVADVDGDGRPDLVACTTATGVGDFRVYLGQADGGFADGGAHPTPTGEGAWELVATDLGSGVLDVITANRSGGTLTLFRGDGAGGFGQPAELPVGAGAQPYGLVADDFDHLHGRDLAYADNANGRVGVLLNQGNGTFRDGGLYPVGAAPLGLVVGDFSHTGEPSLAVGVSGSDEVRLLINDGSGAFRDGGTYGVGSGRMPEGLATGDFNADGKLDLAVANYQGESVGILLGR